MKARLLAAVLVGAIVAPLWLALAGSLSPEETLLARPPLFPRPIVLDHYVAVLRQLLLPLRNSLVVAGSTTAACILLATPAAWALARLRFFGRDAILIGVLAAGMFPHVSVLAPLYLVLRKLHLIDRGAGLVLPYTTFALPLALWLLVGYFRQLPRELEEAALVDGATRLGALVRVVVPLAAPGIATTAILTFISCWNEFLFALAFTTDPARHTLPVAIALFRGRHLVPWGQILAATMIATLPVAVLTLAFQRHILRGLTSGAVK